MYLLGVHDGADADGERLARHLADVVAEEALVGLERVVGERLDARARHERRARLVEGDVSVGPDAADEQVHAARLLDELLEARALAHQVGRVAVEHVRVGGVDVHVLEELVPHVVVVRLWVIAR